MKPYLLSILALVLLFTGCKEDYEIIDYAPIAWNIIVKDQGGNNLLDAEYTDNVIKNTSISYNDEKYSIVDQWAPAPSRALGPVFFVNPWLGTDYFRSGNEQVLIIGRWDATKKWNDETVYINWPNGERTKLSFSLNEKGWTNAQYYVDGKPSNGPVVQFIKRGDRFELTN